MTKDGRKDTKPSWRGRKGEEEESPSTRRRKARETRRPTVAITQVDHNRIQESIFGVFKKNDYRGIDLEALIYFTMQAFAVTVVNYDTVYEEIKKYIIDNFAIQQGAYLRLQEVNMRRLIVCYTVERGKE